MQSIPAAGALIEQVMRAHGIDPNEPGAVPDVARLLGMSERALYRWRRGKNLPDYEATMTLVLAAGMFNDTGLEPRGGVRELRRSARVKPEASDARRLPGLLDPKALADELGVTHAAAEAIMRRLPKVQVPGLRKVYVKREDVSRLIDDATVKP